MLHDTTRACTPDSFFMAIGFQKEKKKLNLSILLCTINCRHKIVLISWKEWGGGGGAL